MMPLGKSGESPSPWSSNGKADPAGNRARRLCYYYRAYSSQDGV